MLNWILENHTFEENQQGLEAAITRAGMTYEIVDYIPFGGGDFSRFGPQDFLFGSLEFSLRVMKDSPTCNVFHTVEAYECSSYYPAFKGLLLNDECTMIPYRQLRDDAAHLFERFGRGEHECFFVRPSSGLKTFTGIVMCRKTLGQDIEFIERYSDIPPDTLIVVAPATNIAREFRFIVKGREVVTGSLYKVKSTLKHEVVEPGNEAFHIAREFLDKTDFSPDPMWVLDTCQTESGEWRVLEVGCLSCAGLYACDLNKVVRAVGEVINS